MKHKVLVAFLVTLIMLTVGFTWNNSRKSVEQSNSESRVVSEKLQSVLDESENAVKVPVNKVRKMAHVVEFFALGLEISALSFVLKKRFLPQSLWNILSSLIVIAIIDESIQILSGRGATVIDILLDFCGGVIGFLIALLVRFIIISYKNRNRRRA